MIRPYSTHFFQSPRKHQKKKQLVQNYKELKLHGNYLEFNCSLSHLNLYGVIFDEDLSAKDNKSLRLNNLRQFSKVAFITTHWFKIRALNILRKKTKITKSMTLHAHNRTKYLTIWEISSRLPLFNPINECYGHTREHEPNEKVFKLTD